jgi:hypothetical protein
MLGQVAPHAVGAHPIEAPAAHPQQQPASDRSARAVKRLRLLPRLHEHVVDSVLGGGFVTEHVQADGHQRSRVAVIEPGERPLVSGGDAADGEEVLVIPGPLGTGSGRHGYAPCVRSDHRS